MPCISGLRVFGKGNGDKPKPAEASVTRSGPLDFVVSTGEAPDVVGYNILWGNTPEQLYHSYMVMGTKISDKRIGALVKGRDYYVRVDTFNENGITEGIVKALRCYTDSQLKHLIIQFLAVMLEMTWLDKEQMVSHKRLTTCSKEANTWLRNPSLRISFQICSIGFISGVYGGI